MDLEQGHGQQPFLPTYGNCKPVDSGATTSGPYNLYPGRDLTRTPSPTPSEVEALTYDVWWKNPKFRSAAFWKQPRTIITTLIVLLILAIIIVISVEDKQIIHAMEPFIDWMKDTKGAFLVPIAILIIISFPPLFGQEFVGIICGIVYGPWVGFAIVAAGTLIGECLNFLVFKYACRARAEKMESSTIIYASLARALREGGLHIAIAARVSILPAHYTTAVFSVCGMSFWTFLIANIVTCPMNMINVYIGDSMEKAADGSGGESKTETIIKDVFLVFNILATIYATRYIRLQINRFKPEVVYARRKARGRDMIGKQLFPQPTLLYGEGGIGAEHEEEASVFNPSSVNLQWWDQEGRAVGYAADPRVGGTEYLAPKPQYPNAAAATDGMPPRGAAVPHLPGTREDESGEMVV